MKIKRPSSSSLLFPSLFPFCFNFYILFNIFFFQIGFLTKTFAEKKDLTLQLGEIKKIQPSHNRAWVQNGKIIQLIETEGSYLIKGLNPGFTYLRVGKDHYSVSVITSSQMETFELLKKETLKTLNLESKIYRGLVLLTGRLVQWSDYERVIKGCQEILCEYQSQLNMGESIKKKVLEEIKKKLSGLSLPRLKIEIGEISYIRLPEKTSQFSEIEKALRPYGVKVLKDLSSLELAPLVDVHITVAEIKKNKAYAYGIKWPESYQARWLPQFATQDAEAFLDLHFLETKGLGRILASPNILCRSGKEAEFLAGGEFPIKILNLKTRDVIWKKYGVMLKVRPLVDESGHLSIFLETEISTLDRSQVVDGIPALHTNRVQSHFDLAESKMIVLSGLIKSMDGETASGLPSLMNLPILGPLFSNKEFQENKTELVIFVQPQVINPLDDVAKPQLPKDLN